MGESAAEPPHAGMRAYLPARLALLPDVHPRSSSNGSAALPFPPSCPRPGVADRIALGGRSAALLHCGGGVRRHPRCGAVVGTALARHDDRPVTIAPAAVRR